VPEIETYEDPDVSAALLELFNDEGIDVLLETQVSTVSEGLIGLLDNVPAQANPQSA
jgi:hypothetical protein